MVQRNIRLDPVLVPILSQECGVFLSHSLWNMADVWQGLVGLAL